MATTQSTHRLETYAIIVSLVIAGVVLEQGLHEMHVSKLLFFGAISAWARELPPPARWVLLGMVALLWLTILVPWYTYRHQHLVPLGHGAYRIEN